jgi:catechol-2,3-dioxygenase
MKIEILKLYTSNLQEQLQFYRDVLELPVKKKTENTFEVQVGYSVLEFEEVEEATVYHIAFHISARREEQALKWLEQRLEVLKDGSDKIVDFPGWNAKSVYFYDADKNIVEFISRREFFVSETEGFSEEDIVGISEIGLATDDVEEKFRFLNSNCGLQKFTGDYERFCATGDDEGLFIIINKNIKDWIPTGDTAHASPFKIVFSVEKASYRVTFQNDRIKLL